MGCAKKVSTLGFITLLKVNNYISSSKIPFFEFFLENLLSTNGSRYKFAIANSLELTLLFQTYIQNLA